MVIQIHQKSEGRGKPLLSFVSKSHTVSQIGFDLSKPFLNSFNVFKGRFPKSEGLGWTTSHHLKPKLCGGLPFRGTKGYPKQGDSVGPQFSYATVATYSKVRSLNILKII